MKAATANSTAVGDESSPPTKKQKRKKFKKNRADAVLTDDDSVAGLPVIIMLCPHVFVQPELVEFMTRSPVVLMVLEGEDAVARNREIMGATNPAEAADNTLRKLYAESIGENTVHGSDSPENAAIEIAYFFRASTVG